MHTFKGIILIFHYQAMSLLFMNQNVRELRTKLNDFMLNLDDSGADIACITESWLDDNIFDAELISYDHSLFRRDRD